MKLNVKKYHKVRSLRILTIIRNVPQVLLAQIPEDIAYYKWVSHRRTERAKSTPRSLSLNNPSRPAASPCEIETSVEEKRFNRLHKRLFRSANILFVVTGIQTERILFSARSHCSHNHHQRAFFLSELIGMFSDIKS